MALASLCAKQGRATAEAPDRRNTRPETPENHPRCVDSRGILPLVCAGALRNRFAPQRFDEKGGGTQPRRPAQEIA
ncbi:hypothetical protein [Salipiger sp.]|uniref:hypothetical protein n=1 Tax=Salipiger sp. TaxID=2078585 RepID=UPI003A97F487